MNSRLQARRRPALAAARILFLALIGSTTLYAQLEQTPATPTAVVADATPRTPTPDINVGGEITPVSLLVGRSTLIDLGTPIARVSLTSADIADAMVTAPSQLLLHGKVPGSISMLIWSRSGAVSRFEVAVQRDLTRLNEQISELFPSERIQVHANGRQIVLSGTVSGQDVVERAKNLALGFVDRAADVVALLQVQPARSNQVLLRVRFAEVSRNALTELGASFFTSPTGVRNTVGRLTTQQFGNSPTFSELEWTKDGTGREFGRPVTSASGKFEFSDFLNLFLLSERYDLGLLVKALQTRGIFQSLAEPNLVAESGKEASFLAGGEFPVPVAQGSGNNASITVDFKEFGIRLSFTPTVNGDRVHLKVRPEVSTLDYGNAVVLQGFRIPALTTRRTETELELRDGQTFAIAGLINNQMNSTLRKIPGIGDIPILGYLFKSKAAEKGQTELVVMITPEILPVGSNGVTPNIPRLMEPFLAPPRDNEMLPPPPAAFTPGRSQFTVPAAAPPALAGPNGPAAPTAAAVPPPILTPPPAQPAASDEAPRVLTDRERKEAEARAKEQAKLEKAEAERLRKEEEQALKEEERAKKAAAAQAKREAEQARKDAERARKEAERQQKAEAERLKREAAEARKVAADLAQAQKEEQARIDRIAAEQEKRDAEAAKRQAEAEKKANEEARREAEREAERERQQQVAAAQAKLKAAQAEYQAAIGKSAAR
jgi:pilus assembly protein CpaC